MATTPPRFAPMKATSSPELPRGDGWSYEIKWDGMRGIATVVDGELQLHSSNLIDATDSFPELAPMGAAVTPSTCVLDGELVALGEDGLPSFGLMQQRMHVSSRADATRRAAEVPVTYVVFDLLWCGDHDITAMPWKDRRRLLEEVVDPGPSWRVSPVYDDGEALFDAAKAQGMEGIMAKRVESPYTPAKRSPAWRKVKVRRRQELVVGGWLPGEGGREGRIGALLVGYHRPDGTLHYAGRVGTGFSDSELRRLEDRFAPLAIDVSPFEPPPPRADIARGVTWLRPELVAEVAFGEWTSDDRLRHPSYMGLRSDKSPEEVIREP
jgi:bifunctional non-homologous end joining protein LigD